MLLPTFVVETLSKCVLSNFGCLVSINEQVTLDERLKLPTQMSHAGRNCSSIASYGEECKINLLILIKS